MKAINNTTVINGVEFKTYKHWSYDGNVGIYLMDGVSRVGELVNDEFIFRNDFSKEEIKWLHETQSSELLSIIFN